MLGLKGIDYVTEWVSRFIKRDSNLTASLTERYKLTPLYSLRRRLIPTSKQSWKNSKRCNQDVSLVACIHTWSDREDELTIKLASQSRRSSQFLPFVWQMARRM